MVSLAMTTCYMVVISALVSSKAISFNMTFLQPEIIIIDHDLVAVPCENLPPDPR